jgi:hypothetical protein
MTTVRYFSAEDNMPARDWTGWKNWTRHEERWLDATAPDYKYRMPMLPDDELHQHTHGYCHEPSKSIQFWTQAIEMRFEDIGSLPRTGDRETSSRQEGNIRIVDDDGHVVGFLSLHIEDQGIDLTKRHCLIMMSRTADHHKPSSHEHHPDPPGWH